MSESKLLSELPKGSIVYLFQNDLSSDTDITVGRGTVTEKRTTEEVDHPEFYKEHPAPTELVLIDFDSYTDWQAADLVFEPMGGNKWHVASLSLKDIYSNSVGDMGRPRIPQLASGELELAIRLHQSRKMTVKEICEFTGIKRQTLYRYLRSRKKTGDGDD